ncbi:FAD-dependent oxidoreductase [Anaerocolumna xylanovorans]|uniref:Glycine/D-amino acid oxidase n=1 Tax=Anaerocolumna xylanovorans DSM 12503 TaxID=1121345 RepID=A0A1M7YDT6_9FIRM|nr:FAD-dependent oxidoreductase [Anaerocolumna xylanovorans]SHO50746.1 Glycine/D-amino acid oxidase [Anaerocolumna xylanovorans DSM 12503]
MPSNRYPSIWEKDASFEERSQWQGESTAEAVIIGAGLTGILTAHMLKKKGVDCILLEGDRTASGQSRHTTAKITSLHGLLYDQLIKDFGKEKASLYAKANEEAISRYESVIKENSISCHFEKLPAVVYTTEDPSAIEKEVQAARECGIPAEFTNKASLPFPVKGAVRFPDQAQFNPLEFLSVLARPLTIYENSRVIGIEKDTVITKDGKIRAKHIIMTSHYPFLLTPGYYFARMHQERSYCLALKTPYPLDGTYKEDKKEGFSFRRYEDMLILGGSGHRTGENKTGGQYDALRTLAKQHFPDALESYCWSAQDCQTLDGIPYIGHFSDQTPDWYVATGFAKWGMTTAMAAADILSDLITGKENPYEEVFTPQRFKLTASIGSLLSETKHSAVGLVLKKLKPVPSDLSAIEPGTGRIVELDGEKVGIYKDKHDVIYAVDPKCPHLGCQLEWNEEEQTWDCPCHGSRFDYDGKLLDEPAGESIIRREFHEESPEAETIL